MRYKLRVHLGGGAILERTVQADRMFLADHGDLSGATGLDGEYAGIVAVRYSMPRDKGLPETEFDCLVTLEEDPE